MASRFLSILHKYANYDAPEKSERPFKITSLRSCDGHFTRVSNELNELVPMQSRANLRPFEAKLTKKREKSR